MVVKVDTDLVLIVLVEFEVVEESEPKVVEDSEPEQKIEESESEVKESEVEEPLIETHIDLPEESTMKLISFLTAISLRSSDIYDLLQIFLREIGSQEINLLMVQSAVSFIFIMDDSRLFVTYDWLDLPSFIAGLS